MLKPGKPGDRRNVSSFSTFAYISTAISDELVPAQPLKILPLPKDARPVYSPVP